MAVRFRCSRCSRQIRMESFPAEGVRCPSCRVRLRKRGAPAPYGSRLRYAAAAATVLLIVAGAAGWTAYGQWRPRPNVVDEAAPAVVSPVQVAQAPPAVPAPAVQEPALAEAPLREPAVGWPADPQPPPPAEAPAAPFKRLSKASEEDLRDQLSQVPVVALDSVPKASARLREMAAKAPASDGPFAGPALLLPQRPDLQGLPLLKGADCRLGPGPAACLEELSDRLHNLLRTESPAGLRSALLNDSPSEWVRPEAVPCLVQMLQVQDARFRQVFVEVLSRIDGRRAAEALAQRAVMDLNPDVREAAARALLGRPAEDYRPVLLAGLRYPWAPAATHAAEVLAFLGDAGAVPQLERMLAEPDPTRAFTLREGGKETTVVREVVRINHLSNCLLCHPPSFARADRVRGAVPTPGKPLPERYTNRPGKSDAWGKGGPPEPDLLVRADTTFLRQDFSVTQPVPNAGKWPPEQRFDHLVRVRPATQLEERLAGPGGADPAWVEARAAARFALREITGKQYRLDGTVRAAAPERY